VKRLYVCTHFEMQQSNTQQFLIRATFLLIGQVILMLFTLYAFFWAIPRRLNSDAGELPRKKHTTFRTRRKFEIKNNLNNVLHF